VRSLAGGPRFIDDFILLELIVAPFLLIRTAVVSLSKFIYGSFARGNLSFYSNKLNVKVFSYQFVHEQRLTYYCDVIEYTNNTCQQIMKQL